MDRTQHALEHVHSSGVGLEIGPSYNPVAPKSAGFDVRSIDHLDRDGLVKKYEAIGLPPDQLARIEPVDYVWTGQPLSAVVGPDDLFDYIVASHVIEHTVDLISFVNECMKLLRPGGLVSLIVPDKRFCFDQLRPLSSAGAIVEAHLQPRTFHPVASFVDTHLYTVRRFGTDNTWDIDSCDNLEIPVCSWQRVRETVGYALPNDVYIDIHRWVFTPGSFRLLLADLNSLGYLDAEVNTITETHSFEFFVTLRAPTSATPPFTDVADPRRQELLRHIAAEETFNLLAQIDQLRQSRSWRVTRPLRAAGSQWRRIRRP